MGLNDFPTPFVFITHAPGHTIGADHIVQGADIVTVAQLMGYGATKITET